VTSVFDGSLTVLKVLFEQTSLQVDAVGRVGNSSLMWAAYFGETDVVKYLLTKGADVNLINEDGHTALQLASKKGHRDIVKLLRNYGARR
jgi:ankyrin repeat protein